MKYCLVNIEITMVDMNNAYNGRNVHTWYEQNNQLWNSFHCPTDIKYIAEEACTYSMYHFPTMQSET